MACALTPAPPRPADPYLFGVNSLLGAMTNLAYDDPSLVAATRAIGAGALRYPGGTLANFWSFAQAGYAREAIPSPRCSHSLPSRRLCDS